MQKELSKQEIITLYQGLHSVGNLEGVKFTYAVSRNISYLKPEVDAIQASLKPSKVYFEYDKKRAELAEKHAVKEKGNPKKSPDGQKYIIADQAAFDKELKELQNKHKEVIDERKKQENSAEKLLEEKVMVELHWIELSEIPENIKGTQMNAILPVIKQ